MSLKPCGILLRAKVFLARDRVSGYKISTVLIILSKIKSKLRRGGVLFFDPESNTNDYTGGTKHKTDKGASMRKRSMLIATGAMAALMMISGCGSADTQNTDDDNTTPQGLIGYYKDSGVVGVDYHCGELKGKTGPGGEFRFEGGKGCTFSFAGLTLRTVPAANLDANITIVEDDLLIARLLQSIDSDDDPSNGITLDDATRKKLLEFLSGKKIKRGDLTGKDVEDAIGSTGKTPRDKDKVKKHLAKTLAGLLGGKTFYSLDRTDHTESTIEFNDAVTQLKIADAKEVITLNFELEGTLMRVKGDDEKYAIFMQRKGYLALAIYEHGRAHKALLLFDSEQKRTQFLKNFKSIKITAAMLRGKTFYLTYGSRVMGGVEYHKFSFSASQGKVRASRVTFDYKGGDAPSKSTKSGEYRYEITPDGRLKAYLNDAIGYWTLVEQYGGIWVLNMDMVFDSSTNESNFKFVDTWFADKPASFPSEL
jgi:hypothetical protein